MKKALLISLLLVAGCGDHPYEQKKFVGTVSSLRAVAHEIHVCTDMVVIGDNGTVVTYSLSTWPPAWEHMHGEMLLQAAGPCGYNMVSAKQQ